MTLDNLKLAILLNNEILLKKINDLKDTISNITGIEILDIKKDIENLVKQIQDAQDDIDNINNVQIVNINQNIQNLITNISQISSDLGNLKDKVNKQTLDVAAINKSIQNLSDDLSNHINNSEIHVTKSDKDNWNSILKTAKKYAKDLFDSLTSFNIEIVEELPEGEDIKEMTIYFKRNEHDNESDYYEEYMYINSKWEIIGSTFVNLSPYVLKSDYDEHLKDFENYKKTISNTFSNYYTTTQINEFLKEYLTINTFNNKIKSYSTTAQVKKLISDAVNQVHTHDNKTILDKISESSKGEFLFNGKVIKTGSDISPDDNNAIEQRKNGLFVDNKTEQIEELSKKILDVGQYVAQVENFEDTPIGHILSFMGTVPPPHYLMCDGTEYNISDYQKLANFFVEQYGKVNEFGGDGINTFCVPSLNSSIVLFSSSENDIIGYVKCIKFEPTYYIAYTASKDEINEIKRENNLLKEQNELLKKEVDILSKIADEILGGMQNV